MGTEHPGQWTLQCLRPRLLEDEDRSKYQRLLTISTFDLWVSTVANYELVLSQRCPQPMFEDLMSFLKDFREDLLPDQQTLALTDQDANLGNLCKTFNRRLQYEVAKSLRSECKIVLEKVNRWLTILREVRPSLPTDETCHATTVLLTFRRFCEKKIILEAVPPSEVVTFLDHYDDFCVVKEDLNHAIHCSPVPIGAHYPYVVDLSIILTQATSPLFLPCTGSEIFVPKDVELRREFTVNTYRLSAEIVYYGVRDLVRAFRKPVVDGLKDTVYVRHLYKIAHKLNDRKNKMQRFLDHCHRMVKNIKKGTLHPSKEICCESQEIMKRAQLLVRDMSFKLRVYVRRRLMKLYDHVLKDMERVERRATKEHRKLANPPKLNCATLLLKIRRTRKFWESFLDDLLQELYENKSVKLVMNLEENHGYFSKLLLQCQELK